MSRPIIVHSDPHSAEVPKYLDTNLTYEAYWDVAKEQWTIYPVPLRTFDEFMPF